MYAYPITGRQSLEEGILDLGLEAESQAEAENRQLWR